jgi:hypothetical protein
MGKYEIYWTHKSASYFGGIDLYSHGQRHKMKYGHIIVVICVFFPSPVRADCDVAGMSRKHPVLNELFRKASALRKASNDGKSTFPKLMKDADELDKLAEKQTVEIQNVGCGTTPDIKTVEDCLKPIVYGCEAIPAEVDRSVFSKLKKSKEEQLAFDLMLFEPKNLMETCCGDFGCTDGGVGIPSILYEAEDIKKLAELATLTGKYAENAQKTLHLSVMALRSAKCGCTKLSADDLKELTKTLRDTKKYLAGNTPAQKRITSAFEEFAKALGKGLPKEECKKAG